MIIFGLGSNLGDRMQCLREACDALIRLFKPIYYRCSPVYRSNALLNEHSEAWYDLPYLNMALYLEEPQLELTPLNLLAEIKALESNLGRVSASDIDPKTSQKKWGAPRSIDIDLLALDDLVIEMPQLVIPHPGLLTRRFALWPLSDIAPFWSYPGSGAHMGQTAEQLVASWGSRFVGDDPLRTRQIFQRVISPQWVGILNVTPDSFSDGNAFLDPEAAFEQAHAMVEAGAEVIDIGAESTRPGAKPVDSITEWQRLQPVLEIIDARRNTFLIPPKISVDTRHADVAAKAMAYHPHWINDVNGFDDPAMRDLLANTGCHCVVMHHFGIPADPTRHLTYNDLRPMIDWGRERIDLLMHAGILMDRIIFDPGIGFGKSAPQSWALIREIAQFRMLNVPLLVGHSRKSFLTWISPNPIAQERDIESAALSCYFVRQGVDYLRVHNVSMHARMLRSYEYSRLV